MKFSVVDMSKREAYENEPWILRSYISDCGKYEIEKRQVTWSDPYNPPLGLRLNPNPDSYYFLAIYVPTGKKIYVHHSHYASLKESKKFCLQHTREAQEEEHRKFLDEI